MSGIKEKLKSGARACLNCFQEKERDREAAERGFKKVVFIGEMKEKFGIREKCV